MLSRERIRIETSDGWTLAADLVLPPGDALGCAVLAHAMMVDRRTMDHPRGEGLASTLARRGLCVLNADLRGHGESGPLATEGGRWSYDDVVRRDLPALIGEARARFPHLPITLVGHSLGAHAAMISAGLAPDSAPDAIVGVASLLWLPRFEPSARRRVLQGVTLAGWAALTAPLGRFESRRLGLGPAAESWAYVRQLVGFFFRGALRGADGADYEAALGRVRAPVLAISSTGDRFFARPPAVARFLGTLRSARVTHRVVDLWDVDPPPDHIELVMDGRCAPLWEEIASFALAQPKRAGQPRQPERSEQPESHGVAGQRAEGQRAEGPRDEGPRDEGPRDEGPRDEGPGPEPGRASSRGQGPASQT